MAMVMRRFLYHKNKCDEVNPIKTRETSKITNEVDKELVEVVLASDKILITLDDRLRKKNKNLSIKSKYRINPLHLRQLNIT